MPETELSFLAQVLKVESKVTITQDRVVRILLETNDTNVLEAGKWPTNQMVSVGIVLVDDIKRR